MKLLITGDLVVNQAYNVNRISDEIRVLFKQSDYSIVNLEAPVTHNSSKIIKTGPHLKSNKKSTLDVLKYLNIDAVTLANNHILDYDEKGVIDTLTFCNENKIQTVGAGKSIEEAAKTLFISTPKGKIAIVNFAENEWASATNTTAGANPMNIIDNVTQIKEARKMADFVFLIIHGGHEYYNLPSPRMQKQYRFYAEQGADIVIGHHTHCISGNEVYNGVPIYYSLGNFLFTSANSYEDWYLGFVLEIEINNDQITTNLHPIKQQKQDFALSLLNNDEKDSMLNRAIDYNKIIIDIEKLSAEWNKHIENKYDTYMNYWSPLSFIKNHFIRLIFNKLGMKAINKSGIALKLNLMRCEAHSDISKEVTQNYLNK
tara:strand:- start:4409 stop:5524 length:1116 start_codon:yes stop_codon:yes gene_type:complete